MYALTADAFVPGGADRATAGALDDICVSRHNTRQENRRISDLSAFESILGISTYTGTPRLCIFEGSIDYSSNRRCGARGHLRGKVTWSVNDRIWAPVSVRKTGPFTNLLPGPRFEPAGEGSGGGEGKIWYVGLRDASLQCLDGRVWEVGDRKVDVLILGYRVKS